MDPFAPAKLGPIELRNRIIKSATFEGVTAEHVVSEKLIEFHRAVARGGVGMTTVAYCAVSPEGAALSVQIGHAGAVAAAAGLRGVSPSPVWSPAALRRRRAVSESDMARIAADFASAARIAVAGGADAIEIHLGHGYLLNEFLSPDTNPRRDRFGGSLENRARFPRDVVRRVRDSVGPRTALVAKLNMADGVRGGLWLDESMQVGRWLETDGALDALVLTGGSSLKNPMYLFRGEAPLAELAAQAPPAMRWGLRLFGKRFLPEYPFEEAFFLPYARQFRAALRMPLALLGGVTKLETIHSALNEEGFEFVAMGRALLREPDLIERYRKSAARESLCVHCNKCMATIYRGTHCVLVE